MAKHFYHIPLQKALSFIKSQRTELRAFVTESKLLNYHSQIGKSIYTIEVEKFITFFKIDKEIDYALKTLEYFHSKLFLAELSKSLNFVQFEMESNKVDEKSFFYAFCALYDRVDNKGFMHFIDKTLLHYHTAFHNSSNISIDYQGMCHTLAKSKKLTLKESFGEENDEAFFRILIDGKVVLEQRGKRIKTLRKKVYKELLDLLVSWEETNSMSDIEVAVETFQNLKV